VTVARRRGNPKWGSGQFTQPPTHLATAFEEQVHRLGLTQTNCITSEELRQWCKRNKDHCYIPEWLLKRWGMSVEPHFARD
jgi:hypothetical protein